MEELPERGTDAYDWYWQFGICRDSDRCGRPKTEPHDLHVQYDAGGSVLATWWDPSHYKAIDSAE